MIRCCLTVSTRFLRDRLGEVVGQDRVRSCHGLAADPPVRPNKAVIMASPPLSEKVMRNANIMEEA